jgi:glycerol uptake facilitator-like aquaporin
MDAERHRPARAGGSGAEFAPQIAPLVAGTAVTTALFVGIPVSSGCLNSSRALAVAMVSGVGWPDLWVFIVGPYAGATAAAALYTGVFAGAGWHAQAAAAAGCGPRRGGGAAAPG